MNTVKETLEWRLIAFTITLAITFFWTGKLLEATGLAILLNVSKTLAYYLWRKYKKGHIKLIIRKLTK